METAHERYKRQVGRMRDLLYKQCKQHERATEAWDAIELGHNPQAWQERRMRRLASKAERNHRQRQMRLNTRLRANKRVLAIARAREAKRKLRQYNMRVLLGSHRAKR